MNNIVFGSGPLGQWVAELLTGKGQAVTLVNRSGKVNAQLNEKIKFASCDANDPQQVTDICKEADAVFHCAMPPYTEWPQKFPALMKGIIDGVAQTKAKLIFGDNLYMYGPTNGNPINEDLPYAATGHKGKVRAQMAEMLMEAHNSGRLQATIGRASDFFGPRVINAGLGEMFFKPALAGKTVNLIGNIDLPHTYSYIKDYAAGLIVLSEHEKAFGRAWHIPNSETITTREMVKRIEEELGKPIKVRPTGKGMVSFLGLFMPMVREVKEMMYSYEEPFIVDHSRFAEHFSFQPTPVEQAIKETVAWYKSKENSL